MITDEKINLNYTRWIDGLKAYNCYSEQMINDIGDKIKNASFAMIDNSGCAYQGSLLNVVLNYLCKMALHLNDKALEKHPFLKVNPNMLMRVLLLQHISKCEMFVVQQNQWKLKNGYVYDFNTDLNTVMKCGERSLYICQKYGIELTEEEYEAIRIIDKEDTMTNPYINPLCQIVKMANQLTTIELHRIYENNNKQNNTKEE